jgi:hypothetical protein
LIKYCILPLNKTHNEIKTDEDKTMNINNNPIVHPQQEATIVLGISKGFNVLEICNESAGYRANSFLLPLQFVLITSEDDKDFTLGASKMAKKRMPYIYLI